MAMTHIDPNFMRRAAAGAAVCATLGLAACGGGGGNADTPAADALVPGSAVPVSATTSAGGAFAFVMSLLAGTSETAEPIALGDATLGTSETEEARPL